MKKIFFVFTLLILTNLVKSQTVLADTVYYPDGGTDTKVIQYRNQNVMSGLMLLASKSSVSVASLATTNLDFASGVSLATHTPMMAVIKYNSGTLGIGVIRIKTDAGYMMAGTALLGLTSTDNNYLAILGGAVRNTGNIGIEVTTASLGASNISVYVYGVKKL